MDLKQEAKEIFLAAIEGVKPKNVIFKEHLYKEPFYLFGSGKASIEGAKRIEEISLKNIKEGFVVSNYKEPLLKTEVFESSHPIPSQKSVKAAEILIKKLSSLKEEDKFIYLLSGGSSALLEKPISPITLDEFKELTKLLLLKGADIKEINTVRKHLSLVKGGRLAKLTKAKGKVLVISDVLGDSLETIGSAPFYLDRSFFLDAKNILVKYEIWPLLPSSIKDVIKKGLKGEILETLKEENKNIEHIIVANNFTALKEAAKEAKKRGFSVEILKKPLEMDVKEAAKFVIKKARESKKECVIFGGECTVEVKGEGKGGRNQELALRVLRLMKREDRFVFLSGGTDGIDGNSDAAGAVVDFFVKENIKEEIIDKFLENNDSNTFFKKFKGEIKTSFTGTNVADIGIILKER